MFKFFKVENQMRFFYENISSFNLFELIENCGFLSLKIIKEIVFSIIEVT